MPVTITIPLIITGKQIITIVPNISSKPNNIFFMILPRFYFSYPVKSFTTSPAIINPATDGTNELLPGI